MSLSQTWGGPDGVSGVSGKAESGVEGSTRMFHQQFALQFGAMLPHVKRVICLLHCCEGLNHVIIQHQPKRDLVLSPALPPCPKRDSVELVLGKIYGRIQF